MSLTKQRPLRRVRGGRAISLTRPEIEYILSMRKQKQHDAEIRHGASRGASHDHVHPPGDRFLATLARMLHEAGTPAHQLEGLVTSCAQRLGMSVAIFSLPTWINITVEDGEDQRTVNLRVDPGSPKLALLEGTYRVADRVACGELDAPGGTAALRGVRESLHKPSALTLCIAYALFSAGAARFLGGDGDEMLAALPVGFALGVLLKFASRRRERELLGEFGGACVSTILAAIIVRWMMSMGMDPSLRVVSLAGLVTLLPGLSLATAMSELSTRNLASGSARLIGAITTLAVVGMGAAIGDKCVALMHLVGEGTPVIPSLVPQAFDTTLAIALVSIAIGLSIVFQCKPKRTPLVFASCIIGFAATKVGRDTIGVEFAPVVAAAAVGIIGNLYARLRRQPTLVIVLPGIALLLPGSLGFRGIQDIFAADTLAGLNTAVSALVVAASIAAGLLIANAVLPSPRHV